MQENNKDKSPIKKRILQYLEFKDITKYRFYKDANITAGILSQNNGITEDNLVKFLNYAVDVSIPWLISGIGEMIISGENNPSKPSGLDATKDNEIIRLQRECYEKSNRIIKLLDENSALRKELDDIKKATE